MDLVNEFPIARFGDLFDDIMRRDKSLIRFPLINKVVGTDKTEVYAAVPGLEKDNLDIEIKNNKLYISCFSNKEAEGSLRDTQAVEVYKEYTSVVNTRVLPLPKNANPDDIKASYKDGILHISIGHLAKTKENRKITIE